MTMQRTRRFAGIAGLALALVSLGGARPTAAQGGLPPEAYRQVAVWPALPQARAAGEFSTVAGLAAAGDRLYVADPQEDHIEVLGGDGSPRQRIGRAGVDLGRLRRPMDVSLDGDRLYVADTGNRRVQVFDALTGGFLAAWPGLDQPRAVLATADGVWVAEERHGRLLRFDRAGRLLETWGRGSSGSGSGLDLRQPVGLAIGPDRDLYVADLGRQAVLRVRQGRETQDYQLPDEGADGAPLDVAVDGDGTLYLPNRSGLYSIGRGLFGGTSIDLLSRRVGYAAVTLGPGDGLSASLIDAWAVDAGVVHFPQRGVWSQLSRWSSLPAPLGSLDGPRRLAARANGGAFVADGWPRVQEWRAGGLPGSQFRAAGVLDLSAGPADSVFVLHGDHVARHEAGGPVRWLWPAPGPDAWLAAADDDGDTLAVLDAGRRQIHLLGGSSGSQPTATSVDWRGGLAVDIAAAGGALLLADRERGQLVLLEQGGNERNRWAAPGRVIRVAGQDGQAWFALTDDGWVWKYDGGGRLLAAWDAVPGGQPLDLALNAAGAVLVADGREGRVHVFAPDAKAERPTPPRYGDRCDLRPDKRAAPTEVRAGRPVTVTLSIGGDCPSESLPLDVVLVVDRSGSMEGPKIEAARAVGADFAAELDFRKAHAATVLFASQAELTQALTDDATAVIRGVAQARAGGGTNIAEALALAGEELAGPRGQPDARKAVVLLTDGKPDGGADPRSRSLAEAQALRQAGVAVFAIGLGADVDRALLRELAGESSRYFEAPSAAELAGIYRQIARRLLADLLLRTVDVEDEVPANMRYVQGSAQPAATWDGRVLRWSLSAVATSGLSLRYQLEPLQAGVWPTNLRAAARYTDGVGFTGDLLFPVPYVTVTGGLKAYLPLAFQHRCPKQRSDVVLVLDTSSSMDESATPGGASKMAAARAAAGSFLELLALPEDRAAVVGFNDQATVAADFSGDRAGLRRALEALPRATGTRIDRGLEAAARLMAGPTKDPGRTPVVILLTDGRTAGGTEAAARQAAEALRGSGAALFTIGLGADVDGGLLIELAGQAARYSYAPDQSALNGIYQLLAWSLPCR